MHCHRPVNRGRTATDLVGALRLAGGKVRNRTLPSISRLPRHVKAVILEALKAGEPASGTIRLPSGHVDAVLTAMDRLDMGGLISHENSGERELALGVIAARVIDPRGGPETACAWGLSVPCAEGEPDAWSDGRVREAVRWLLGRQDGIEKRLTARHLSVGSVAALYSVYAGPGFWPSLGAVGAWCGADAGSAGGPESAGGAWSAGGAGGGKGVLSAGDAGKAGGEEVAGSGGCDGSREAGEAIFRTGVCVLANAEGCPAAIRPYAGDAGRIGIGMPLAIMVAKATSPEGILARFGGWTLSGRHVARIVEGEGRGFLAADNSERTRKLLSGIPDFPAGEFGPFELESRLYPWERLVFMRDPDVMRERAATRSALMAAAGRDLERVREMAREGAVSGMAEAAFAAGAVVGRHRAERFFSFSFGDGTFEYGRDHAAIAADARLDGLIVVRSSLAVDPFDCGECARQYLNLALAASAFGRANAVDLRLAGMFPDPEEGARARALVALLAHYVEWHMAKAWSPLISTGGLREAERDAGRGGAGQLARPEDSRIRADDRLAGPGAFGRGFRGILGMMAEATTPCRVCRDAGTAGRDAGRGPELGQEQRNAMRLLDDIPKFE
ncbi:MAG: hypothetical protein LBR80_10325 [Deltaproteobacteria bacterium]|nr:hypothetical protein [Deltaproteobacteria bacterium]